MRFSMTVLFFVVLVCLFGHAYSVGGLGEACADDRTCTTAADHVCDPATKKCTVIADDTKTGCDGDNTKCPTNAACSSNKCACASGYTQEGGLCTVVGSSPITCSSNTDCTDKMANTECAITLPCTKGYCQCKTGYSGVVCQLLGNGQTCDTTVNLCDDGLHYDCTSGKCACTTNYPYKTALGICSDKKVFGEECTATSDCFVGSTGHGECPSTGTKVCGCASGYIQETGTETQTCRLPYRTETCVHGVGCGVVDFEDLLTSDTSQKAPTCSATSTDASGTCGCATSGQTMESAKKGSTCYNYCLTTHSGATTADKQTCTIHSQCTSKACVKCPGDTTGLCYSAPCGNGSGMKKTERGMIVLSFILLLALIF